MLILSPTAQSELSLLLESKEPKVGLRLSVEKGGCAGMQYIMTFTEAQADDVIIEENGARLYVDHESVTFLDGCTIDYSDSLNDAGFKIENPRATRSCGCGTSFEAEADGQGTEDSDSKIDLPLDKPSTLPTLN